MRPVRDKAASSLGQGVTALLTVSLKSEPDIVTARQRARQLARLLGFDNQDQVRFATATSEIARNALQYAGSGRVEFSVHPGAETRFVVKVIDSGPGIESVSALLAGQYRSRTGMGLGITGTRRLMDHFSLDSTLGAGTVVEFGKPLPGVWPNAEALAYLSQELSREKPTTPLDEVRNQNQELMAALDTVRQHEGEIEKRQGELRRLNQELEETNRGVVALYAELDEKAQALRGASEIKTRFMSHMSHEFRTPLNSILALTDLLQRKTDGDLTPAQGKQVGYIRRAAEELFEMVNDLLDLAKVEAGKVEIKSTMVELGPLFGALRGMLRPLVINENVNLIIEDPPDGFTIRTDEGKVTQILRNLISNALKFTERGEVRVSVRKEGQQAVFSVADTGIGIAPADQDHIFTEFGQVDSPLQRRVKGTGLGLPLSRKLAELLGGTLTVSSVLGVGSVFSLSVPAVHAPLARPAAEEEPSEEVYPGAILVIDDEEIARYLVRQLLRGTKYRIIEAATGEEGAERARFEKPQLILLDLTMPGRNGFEVLDELKSDPSTNSIPVVIHTSVTLGPEDLERLNGRHSAILPKQLGGRERALTLMREVLQEPNLFSGIVDLD